jgi:hypothetical protein
MRRRELIGLLAAIAVSPQTALGQTAKNRPIIAWLWFESKQFKSPIAVRTIGVSGSQVGSEAQIHSS